MGRARAHLELRSAAHACWLIAAAGAMFSAVSEFWFYRLPSGTNWPAMVLIYGGFGFLFLLTLRLFQVRAFSGFFVAAAIFGFMVEGIPVSVLYQALPFSIAWTSLAWHALLTLGIGFFLYRKWMAAKKPMAAIALNMAIGVLLGIWNAYTWNAVENEATHRLQYVWHSPVEFIGQFLLGWGVFVGGHALFDAWPPPPTRPRLLVFLLVLGLAMAAFFPGVFAPLFPLSLMLPFLLLISYASLRGNTDAALSPWLRTLLAPRSIALSRYPVSVLIPIGAFTGYWAFWQMRIETATNVPLAGLAVGVSSLLWVWSLLRANSP